MAVLKMDLLRVGLDWIGLDWLRRRLDLSLPAFGHERPLTTGCFVAFQSEQVKQAGLLRSL